MKKAIYAILISGACMQAGCSPEFWGGTAVGALGAGGGYEYNNKRINNLLNKNFYPSFRKESTCLPFG